MPPNQNRAVSNLYESNSRLRNSRSDVKYQNRKYLEEFEQDLKILWTQYMKCVEQEGLTESARAIRQQYFEKYRSYHQNKEWINLVSRSDD